MPFSPHTEERLSRAAQELVENELNLEGIDAEVLDRGPRRC